MVHVTTEDDLMKIAMDWLCDAVTVDSKALKGCVKEKRMNWSVCVNDYLGYPNLKSLAVTDKISIDIFLHCLRYSCKAVAAT